MLMWDAKRKQIEVARAMGITSDSLSRKLKGERGWAISELVRLAGVLDTSVSYLVGESDTPSSPERRSLVPKVAGSNPVGGSIISFPTSPRAA